MFKEESCIVLDFLPQGYADRRHPEPVAQALGRGFSLLELVPKEGLAVKPEEEVYIGNGPRDKIRYIKRSLSHSDLTNFAKNQLAQIINKLVVEEEKRFVEFFNKSGTVTPRMHQLELLPGLGKKHVQDVLEERRKKPFESFQEIVQRVRLFPDPVKAIAKRIMMELEGNEKYNIFAPIKRRDDMQYSR
jgi:putative nucleotide binding protein